MLKRSKFLVDFQFRGEIRRNKNQLLFAGLKSLFVAIVFLQKKNFKITHFLYLELQIFVVEYIQQEHSSREIIV